jgi:hypothetical protein
MDEEKPHPEMTDQDLLEKLLSIALQLLKTDRERGEPLWEIYKYLEGRLVTIRSDPPSETTEQKLETGLRKSKQNLNGTNQIRIINVFTNCHFEHFTIENH